MSEKITVPTLGESVTEATVSKWLKSQGDKVVADEPIVELETDKVNVEVPAPSNGVLGSIDVQEGETVNVGSLLGTISKNLAKDTSGSNEIKNYSPPKKKDNEKNIKLFDNDQKTSEAKKITDFAISIPSPILFIGIFEINFFFKSSLNALVISLSINPGEIQLILIFFLAYSFAKDFDIAITPAFELV